MKIGIVGLGLIGGSLGLDLRSQGHEILGVSRQERTCQIAIARGAVDDASLELALLADTDLIFVCTPIAHIPSTIAALIPKISPATVLTDVGSVKASIVNDITPLWQNFVGGHPMAGTAESGIEAALHGLFAGNPYVLTPTDATPKAAISLLESILRPLQVKLHYCRPEDHDRAVAWISHLPVMASASLIAACNSDQAISELAQTLASSGFRDTSRVGGGNPELGVMMAQYNTSEVVRSLRSYRTQLDALLHLIEHENWADLEAFLKATHQTRPNYLKP
ncbi:prephenate/arogenate dehydrogenase [Myxacorys almedinensis]|uniref:Prephenate/arogenate dehydrogenase n=1 Tax=Myxacorys almedinensis A TaxID=2690445 RepID=A0A8J7Z2T7_9CYAN|nr:prephenate/arogenate dehydrogenase [Myxacorys almedinensis]NDJ18654.1 prephenate/arogenate dehydrogenase [Myxacorys almedinensis A]